MFMFGDGFLYSDLCGRSFIDKLRYECSNIRARENSDRCAKHLSLRKVLRMTFIYLFIYSSLLSLCNLRLWKTNPQSLTDINIHSDTQAEPRKLSSLTLYIDLWQNGKPAPGQNPPVISPPMGVFRRIGVRAEIRTQNPMLSNTALAKMVPLSHLGRLRMTLYHRFNRCI
jgi:hypothetical protein